MRAWIASILAWGLCATAVAKPLPTPYTASDLHDALPDGATITVQLTTPEQIGLRTMTFDRSTRRAVTVSDTFRSPEGEDLEEPSTSRYTWEALRKHALFDDREATRARDTLRTAWGLQPAWRYDVDAGGTKMTFWFADAIPGPPVRMITTLPDGAQVVWEQIARTPSPAGAGG